MKLPTYKVLDAADRIINEGVEGEFDNIPESAFYMVGTIEEAIEKAKKLLYDYIQAIRDLKKVKKGKK